MHPPVCHRRRQLPAFPSLRPSYEPHLCQPPFAIFQATAVTGIFEPPSVKRFGSSACWS
jgi:hypothetical protein